MDNISPHGDFLTWKGFHLPQPCHEYSTIEYFMGESGEFTFPELIEYIQVQFPISFKSARNELSREPVKISKELWDYSLKGLESIKI